MTMAWGISMTAEGWDNVRRNLEHWTCERLINALCDDRFQEVVEHKGGSQHAHKAADALRRRIKDLPQDILADEAYMLIERHNTCDNGGWAVWIDREGYHTVSVDLDDDNMAAEG
jgi:hypothetical protein